MGAGAVAISSIQVGNKQETEYEETNSLVHRYRPKPIDELVKETRFTKNEIKSLYRGFKQECPSGIVNEASFREIYAHYFPQGDCSDFAHFLFCSIDQNADGSVNFEDFLHGLSILVRGSVDEKLRWIFNLYDVNGDGKITKDELQSIIGSVYDLMGRFTEPGIDSNTSKAHVEHIFKKLDIHQTGAVTLDQFLKACYNDSAVINSISTMDSLI